MPATPLSSGAFYQRWLGPVLANDEGLDAEQLSRTALTALGQASLRRRWPGVSTVLEGLAADLQRRDLRLEQVLFGCRFPNPVGLAAGFDKNGVAAGIWDRFGFGFTEVGTVTWHGQPGNPRPRLFRLAAEQAALNRMGFNNDGAQALLKTLERQQLEPPVGDRRCWVSMWVNPRSRRWSRRPRITPRRWSCWRRWLITP